MSSQPDTSDIAAARAALVAAQILLERHVEGGLISKLAGCLASLDDVLELVYHEDPPSISKAREMLIDGFDTGVEG